MGRYFYGDDQNSSISGNGASLIHCQDNVNVVCGLRAIPAVGGALSYQHYWTNNIRSDLTGGWAHYINEFPDDPQGSFRDLFTGHANVIYSPVSNVDLGVEFEYAAVTYLRPGGTTQSFGSGDLSAVGSNTPTGDRGRATRVLTSARVGF